MTEPSSKSALVGKMLVAAPGLPDSLFAQKVILVIDDIAGLLGVAVNMSAESFIPYDSVKRMVGADPLAGVPEAGQIVRDGGPVSRAWLSGVHGRTEAPVVPESGETSWPVGDTGLGYTGPRTMERLRTPHKLVALGVCCWGQGQLEAEIEAGFWHVIDADPALIFDTPLPEIWKLSLKKAGIDADRLVAAPAPGLRLN